MGKDIELAILFADVVGSTRLYELGVRVFVEAPPGQALSNLVKNEFPQARALAAATVHLDSVIHLARVRDPV